MRIKISNLINYIFLINVEFYHIYSSLGLNLQLSNLINELLVNIVNNNLNKHFLY